MTLPNKFCQSISLVLNKSIIIFQLFISAIIFAPENSGLKLKNDKTF